jgi:glycosyltransferase involved in cell wall biosynthesis
MSPTKIAQIFNPMDVMNWRAVNRKEARTALGIPQDTRIVVCHGRIDIVQKGLDILLEAWKQICDQRPGQNLCLLLVGAGSDSPVLRQQIAERQVSNVLWVDEYIRDRTLL